MPYCADYLTVDLARDLVTRFINPALTGEANGTAWSTKMRSWI